MTAPVDSPEPQPEPQPQPGPPSQSGPQPQWGPPAGYPEPPHAEHGGTAAPWTPAQPLPRNGLGTTAMVLGAIGSFVAFLPFLFWIAWILGVLAVVFGLVGLGNVRKGLATNKSSALGGTILGGASILLAVVGLLITGVMIRSAVDRVDGTDSDSSSITQLPDDPEPPLDEEPLGTELLDPAAVQFGESHEYVDGVTVTVAKPSEFSLTGSYVPPGLHKGDRTFHLDLTIVNDSNDSLNLDFAQPHVKDAAGNEVNMLFYSKAGYKPFRGTLAPGERATAQYSYPVSPDAASKLQVEVHPGLLHDHAEWSGPVG
ncbi:DUF4190 domain-containing protein [Streptomyces sp. NBC_00083]|uniref:DUF4190 domain-containing protein n=1 Tax=Streptomyces sp. NBC_00083 TaxID=2975647 RepID=UPI0022578A65|nr:DUF4190 domain-containing protein [Streptomyces sp. NBC_00083]MCX5386636.1 DUF4352 domain-containing protein [Streptomyces sp. NBC_00083]